MKHFYRNIFIRIAALVLAVLLIVGFFLRASLAWLLESIAPRRYAFAAVTYKYWGGGSKINSQTAGIRAGPEGFGLIDCKIDFGAIATQRAADGQAALASGDIIEVISLLANTYVGIVAAKLITPEGGAANIGVGDGAGTSGYFAAFDINGAANTWGDSRATSAYSIAVGGGKLYTAADTIDIILNSANIDVAVLHLFADVRQLDTYRT